MIPNLSGAALLLSNSFELSLVAKATLMLLAGLAAIAFARSARASARHLVIATLFTALAALPILIAFVPALAIDVPVTAVLRTAAKTTTLDHSAPASGANVTEVVTTAAQRTLPAPVSYTHLTLPTILRV